MKTIYLKASSNDQLIRDIKRVFPKYNGEIEFSDGIAHVHYVGDIVLIPGSFENKVPPTFVGAEHANILAPEDFDISIFQCLVEAPKIPKHQFA